MTIVAGIDVTLLIMELDFRKSYRSLVITLRYCEMNEYADKEKEKNIAGT